ncbi:hypothetical protein [Bacillus sp. FJAT-49736]|uniref:hypothetical protein n=1 Tax=Bacillus sp. FJAT-49736 TaxID=2833582 RepID=UPI001BC8E67F|nr:hypothetical protein [Bacillus sp. FJAT-49736]MBS4171713.1 hypothetical protein [Bacillus sp. FJAT-49736]
MEHNEQVELYKAIKLAGFKVEQEVNNWIKDQINHKKLVEGTNIAGKYYVHLMKCVQNKMGHLLCHLNIPSKNDVTSIGKLVLQVEEKVDKVEDQVLLLQKKVDDLKNG